MRELVVAATRWNGDPGDIVGPLSHLLGVGAYDLRLKLRAPLPVILGYTGDEAAAHRLLTVVRGAGHGAVACQMASIKTGHAHQARRFELSGTALRSLSGQQAVELPYADIVAIVAAVEEQMSESVTMTQHTPTIRNMRSSMRRALVPDQSERDYDFSSERVAYIFERSGRDVVAISEGGTMFTGLGDRMRPTKRENFDMTLRVLRELAPHALLDDRLVRTKRKRSSFVAGQTIEATSVFRGTRSTTTSGHSSNASEVGLAAHLIALAHLKGEL